MRTGSVVHVLLESSVAFLFLQGRRTSRNIIRNIIRGSQTGTPSRGSFLLFGFLGLLVFTRNVVRIFAAGVEIDILELSSLVLVLLTSRTGRLLSLFPLAVPRFPSIFAVSIGHFDLIGIRTKGGPRGGRVAGERSRATRGGSAGGRPLIQLRVAILEESGGDR